MLTPRNSINAHSAFSCSAQPDGLRHRLGVDLGEVIMRLLLLVGAALALAGAVEARGSHSVRAHVTKSGTYVAATRATNPDHSRLNNYSARGNVNPYSGRVGTKDPFALKRSRR